MAIVSNPIESRSKKSLKQKLKLLMKIPLSIMDRLRVQKIIKRRDSLGVTPENVIEPKDKTKIEELYQKYYAE